MSGEPLPKDPSDISDSIERIDSCVALADVSGLTLDWAKVRFKLMDLQKDADRLNSNTILIKGRDEFGEPTSCIHKGMDLRAAIDAAMGESH